MTELEEKFLSALKIANEGKDAEALKLFEEVIAADPQGDLADDALYNIGIMQFKQVEFDKAVVTFKKVIEEMPDSTIAEFEGSMEHGKTPAKAWLGLINCYLAMGQEVEAWDALDKLEAFPNSYVMYSNDHGVTFRKTFKMLGQDLLDTYASTKQEVENG